MKIPVEPARKEDIPRLEEIYAGEELHRSFAQSAWYVHAHFDYNGILARVNGKIQGAGRFSCRSMLFFLHFFDISSIITIT